MQQSVYALPNFRSYARAIALRSQLPLVAADSARAWVHFTTNGTWHGHPRGSFTFDTEVYKALIKNFNAQKNPVQLTYEHPSYDDGQPKPAAGWIHELAIRADGLWGLCEFTERAATMIRAGEYKFTSVVVDFESVDRVSKKNIGPELCEVALTNRPFIDGQRPIALTRSERKLTMDIDIKAALKALGLDEGASPEQAAEVLAHAMAALAAQEGKSAEKAEPKEEPMMEASEAELSTPAPAALEAPAPVPGGEGEQAAAAQALSMLQEITGKDAAGALAFLEEHKEQIKALAGAQPESGTESTDNFEDKDATSRLSDERDLLANAVKALSARVQALETEKANSVEQSKMELENARKSEAEAKVSLAVENGRIPETDKAKWVALALEAPERFADIISTITPVVPVGKIGKRALTTPDDFNEADEIAKYDIQLRAIERDPAKRKEIALKHIRKARERAANGRA